MGKTNEKKRIAKTMYLLHETKSKLSFHVLVPAQRHLKLDIAINAMLKIMTMCI